MKLSIRDKARNMNIGDIIECEVIEVGQWGAYLKTTGGCIGFVDCAEFSWTSASTKGVATGDSLTAKVLKLLLQEESQSRRYSFVASIREVRPDLDPWFDNTIYTIGSEFSAVVERSGEDFLIIQLETGALAHVLPDGWSGEPPPENSTVAAQLIEVDKSNRKLRAVTSFES